MSLKNILSRFQKLVRNLTLPSRKIQDSTQRQQAQILATLALITLFVSLIIMPVWVLIPPTYPAELYISVGLIVGFASTYGFSRSRHYVMGASLLTITIFGALFVMYNSGPGNLTERMLVLKYLIVVVLVASLYSRKLTLLVFLVGLSGIVAFFFVPGAPQVVTYSYLVFYLIVSALGITYSELNGRQKRKLVESEEKYQSVIAAMSEGVVMQTQSGVIDACNTAAERILGLSAEQMMGRESIDPRWRSIHEDGTPFPGQEHPAMVTLRTGQPLYGVIMGVHQPDDQLHWISINSQPLMEPNSGLPYAVVTTFTDITVRKQNERTLREAQQRYYALFEQANDAVFIMDLNGRHLEANHRAAELLGYDVSEIQKLQYLDLSAETPKSTQVLEKLLAGEPQPVYERIFRKKDGRLIPVEINVELVRDLDGKPLHIQSVVRDISERKQTQERELELSLEKERTQMLTTFIQNASHEFRTPLSIIETTTFVMARLQDANKRLKRVDIVHNQIERLAKLIKSLLIITKLETSADRDDQPIELDAVLQAVHRQMTANYAPSLTLNFTKPTHLPAVLGNFDELKEAVWQIVDNACRFSPDDGEITAVIGTTDHHVWLEIQDSGSGISNEDIPHIFKTFWRKDDAHSTPGLGLGLAIAQKIIQAHAGEIQVASERNVGTTIRITLPIA